MTSPTGYVRRWWRSREAGEKRTLRLGAVVLAPLLLIFGVWLPLDQRAQQVESGILAARTQLAEMGGMRNWIISRKESAAASRAPLSVGLLPRLEASLRVALPGYKGTVRAAEGGVDIQFEAAPFDALLSWLGQMAASEHLFAVELQLTPAGPGLVAGRLRLREDGA